MLRSICSGNAIYLNQIKERGSYRIMERIIYKDLELYDSETIKKWKKELKEIYPDSSDEELMGIINDDNHLSFEDDLDELKKLKLPESIICIGRLGLWNGTAVGYKEYPSLNILFHCQDGLTKAYVDENGDLRAELHHHDGTNYYLFRMWKSSASETVRDNLMSKIYNKDFSQNDISRYTVRLGDFVGKIYGWAFKGRKSKEFLNFIK